MYDELEIYLIAKLYSYMSEYDRENWTMTEAQYMYDDELLISEQNGYNCPIESTEVLFDTIKEFIRQDTKEEQ